MRVDAFRDDPAMPSLKRLATGIALALMLTWAGAASACPNCKEAVASQETRPVRELGEPTTFMKHGYNYSVLFMMAMPFLLLGTGAFAVVRAVKRGSLPEM
jgi:hypothetical protein